VPVSPIVDAVLPVQHKSITGSVVNVHHEETQQLDAYDTCDEAIGQTTFVNTGVQVSVQSEGVISA